MNVFSKTLPVFFVALFALNGLLVQRDGSRPSRQSAPNNAVNSSVVQQREGQPLYVGLRQPSSNHVNPALLLIMAIAAENEQRMQFEQANAYNLQQFSPQEQRAHTGRTQLSSNYSRTEWSVPSNRYNAATYDLSAWYSNPNTLAWPPSYSSPQLHGQLNAVGANNQHSQSFGQLSPYGWRRAQPNIFGGSDYYSNGTPLGSTIGNVMGGESSWTGSYRTQPNILGGRDFYSNGIQSGSTIGNVMGGESSGDGSYRTQPNVFGGYDYFENGILKKSTHRDVFGGESSF